MLETIDRWLRDVGSQKLVDGDRVRDMLLDLRLMAAREEANEYVQVDDERAGANPLLG